MNKFNKLIILTISALVAFSTSLLADKPRDWQLGFQEPASQSMGEIVWFHNYMLMPIITAISAFVLFLLLYIIVRFRASNNKVASTNSHNTFLEVMWTLIQNYIIPFVLKKKLKQPLHNLQFQSLPKLFIQNASLEISKTKVIKLYRTITGKKIVPFFTKGKEGFDINYPIDFKNARLSRNSAK